MWTFKKEEIVVLSLIGFLLVVSLFMIQSFIIPLLFTFILVYILNPVYKKVTKIFHSESLSSIFITFMILLLLILPMTYGIIELSKEINKIDDTQVESSLMHLDMIIIEKFGVHLNFMAQYDIVISKLKDIITNMVYKIPKIIFDIFIILFFYYYFSKNYDREIHFFQHIFESRKFCYLKGELSKLVHGIIYGQIFVRFIQASIGIIGFLLIGVQGAFIWGIMMFFTGFLPMLGTGIIWVPLAFLYLIKGEIYLFFGIIVIGIIISTIDNFLLPYMVSGKTQIGPVFTLISIIGGIEVFGIYGIILGPFVMGFLFVLLEQMFIEIRNANPKLRTFIWTEKERNNFRELQSDLDRADFVKDINLKYKKKENKK